MNKTIAILGCGWLGLPLARELIKSGYHIKGATTTAEKLPQLAADGIEPYLLKIGERTVNGDPEAFLKGAAILIVNIPPGLRTGKTEDYVGKIRQLYLAVHNSTCRKIIFVSSTSVYGPASGEVTELTPPEPTTPSGIQLLKAEQVFKEDSSLQTIVVRLGGLIGPERHPVTFLSGRKNLQNGDDPVNLIHLNDAVSLLKNVLEFGYWGEIFNGVAPEHPAKRDYYTREARIRSLPPPEYADGGGPAKKVTAANYHARGHVFYTSIYSL